MAERHIIANFSDGTRRNSAEALIGEELKFKITDSTVLEQRFVAYPNISDPGRFRSTVDAPVITQLSKWLGWQITRGNRFNSSPVLGAGENDLILTTGIRATFGGKK